MSYAPSGEAGGGWGIDDWLLAHLQLNLCLYPLLQMLRTNIIQKQEQDQQIMHVRQAQQT